MNKIIITLLFLLFSIYTLFCLSVDEISEYPFEIAAKLEYGTEEGKVGLGVEIIGPNNRTLNAGPMNWRENGEVYIIDGNNHRINVYDENFEYLRKINFGNDETKYFISYIRRILIDENGNIIILISGIDGPELICINNNGDLKILLDHKSKAEIFHSQDFFSTGKELVYSERNNKSIYLIDLNNISESKKNESEKIQWIIENKKKSSLVENEVEDKIDFQDFLKKNKIILYGNQLLTREISKYLKYRNYLKEKLKTKKKSDKFTITEKINNATFLGFDADDNVYWRAYLNNGISILIFDKYGSLIDAVKVTRGGIPSISPTGDIYYFGGGDGIKEDITIYKITRQW